MKRKLCLLFLSFILISCGQTSEAKEEKEENETVEEVVNEEPLSEENVIEEESAEGKVLVAYFSATGTTKGVAEKIAKITDADLYEIVAKDEYTSDDLDWHDDNSRTTHEQNDPNFRVEMAGEGLSLEEYQTIYLGYPIWWGEEPRILDTFVEKYDFDGKTIIPFCTSGSSGIGESDTNLAQLAGSGTWLKGERFSGSVSEEELEKWID